MLSAPQHYAYCETLCIILLSQGGIPKSWLATSPVYSMATGKDHQTAQHPKAPWGCAKLEHQKEKEQDVSSYGLHHRGPWVCSPIHGLRQWEEGLYSTLLFMTCPLFQGSGSCSSSLAVPLSSSLNKTSFLTQASLVPLTSHRSCQPCGRKGYKARDPTNWASPCQGLLAFRAQLPLCQRDLPALLPKPGTAAHSHSTAFLGPGPPKVIAGIALVAAPVWKTISGKESLQPL